MKEYTLDVVKIFYSPEEFEKVKGHVQDLINEGYKVQWTMRVDANTFLKQLARETKYVE